ncbi:B-cell receptor CD22-like [Acanthochromis polyacanthus]|uniref:B-cell receptor CD22-like n=1 Tax=Acanthochromis polyacanthus TaxID=80966 RepID=UPI0022343E05|nr:B-cell receptor CD22-like [Acanthochromis polyacanthus]
MRTIKVSVVQGQDDWGVTFTSTQICAVKGSTVEMSCNYKQTTYMDGYYLTVQKTFWFIKDSVDLTTDEADADRVEYRCDGKRCTLRIRDLRESDSAVYRIRFITNPLGGLYSSPTGVTLSVTDLRVNVPNSSSSWKTLTCHSDCLLPDHSTYVWYKNGRDTGIATRSHSVDFQYRDSFSCALRGFEDFPSASVYAPKLPSVSVSPSAEIMEGSSVTLTCSSNANPAANYTWYKRNGNPALQSLSNESQLIFSSIQSSDSGLYCCTVENVLGKRTSEDFGIDVKYAPKLPSVSVSPSGEIMEGSSVTLTCSSDANPAANYTWYKENEDSPKASGQNFSIINATSKHSGKYYCEVRNSRGHHNSSLDLIIAPGR